MVVISWVIALKSNNSFDNHVALEEQHLKIALFLLQWYSIVLVSMDVQKQANYKLEGFLTGIVDQIRAF